MVEFRIIRCPINTLRTTAKVIVNMCIIAKVTFDTAYIFVHNKVSNASPRKPKSFLTI